MFKVNNYIKTNNQQYPWVEIRGIEKSDPRIPLPSWMVEKRKKINNG